MGKSYRTKIMLAAFGIAILSIYVYFKDPLSGPILPCVFNQVTGLYCPGCGMTRAVHYVFHFKFYEALRFNALIFIIPIPMVIYYAAAYKDKAKIAKDILFIMLLIVIAYGILRNISTFNVLAPGS